MVRSVAVLVALGVMGCSEPGPRIDTSNEGGRGGTAGSGGTAGIGGMGANGGMGGAAGMAGAAPVCNQLELLDTPGTPVTFNAGAAPAARGGTVVDGTYVFARAAAYGQSGPASTLGRTRIAIAGTTWEEVADLDIPPDDPDTSNPTKHYSHTLSASGTTLTLTQTCPEPEPAMTFAYTADATTLTLQVVDHGLTFVEEFEQR